MKLRLKYSGRRVPLEIIEEADNPPTIQKLRDNITNAIPDIDPEFELSLNGKDTLAVEPETPLSDLGIVSGDMIVVKTDQQHQPQQQQQHQPQQQLQHQLQQQQQQLQQQQQQQLQKQQQQKQEQQSAVAQQPTSSQDTVMEDPNKASDDVPMAEFEPEDDPEAIKDELVNRYLRQPLVVSESTADELPESLHKLYTTMAPSSKSEALFLVLHVLMEETGFLAEADVPPHSLPDDWKSRGSYNMTYRHHSSSAATFKMMAIEMGPVFIVHAHGFPKDPKGSHVECSAKIKLTDYVNDVDTEPCRSYKHLALLARTFKDAVAHKILALTCQDTSLVLSLTTLPSELQVEILQYLRAPDLLRVATVCKLLQIRVNSPCIWRRRYLLEFGRRSNCDMNQDWKRLYREKKMERQRLRQHMQRMIRPEFPWGTHPAPPLPMGPFYPPGGIGGDYDRDPFAPNLPGGMFPLGAPRPRFDPFLGPGAPPHQFRPGRGGGINDRLPGLGGLNPGGRRSGGGGMGGLGGFGPRFF